MPGQLRDLSHIGLLCSRRVVVAAEVFNHPLADGRRLCTRVRVTVCLLESTNLLRSDRPMQFRECADDVVKCIKINVISRLRSFRSFFARQSVRLARRKTWVKRSGLPVGFAFVVAARTPKVTARRGGRVLCQLAGTLAPRGRQRRCSSWSPSTCVGGIDLIAEILSRASFSDFILSCCRTDAPKTLPNL